MTKSATFLLSGEIILRPTKMQERVCSPKAKKYFPKNCVMFVNQYKTGFRPVSGMLFYKVTAQDTLREYETYDNV